MSFGMDRAIRDRSEAGSKTGLSSSTQSTVTARVHGIK